MPKKKVANGFRRGIQVFFAAMVCLAMVGPVSVFAAQAAGAGSQLQIPGMPGSPTTDQRLLAAAGDRRSVVGSGG